MGQSWSLCSGCIQMLCCRILCTQSLTLQYKSLSSHRQSFCYRRHNLHWHCGPHPHTGRSSMKTAPTVLCCTLCMALVCSHTHSLWLLLLWCRCQETLRCRRVPPLASYHPHTRGNSPSSAGQDTRRNQSRPILIPGPGSTHYHSGCGRGGHRERASTLCTAVQFQGRW